MTVVTLEAGKTKRVKLTRSYRDGEWLNITVEAGTGPFALSMADTPGGLKTPEAIVDMLGSNGTFDVSPESMSGLVPEGGTIYFDIWEFYGENLERKLVVATGKFTREPAIVTNVIPFPDGVLTLNGDQLTLGGSYLTLNLAA